VFVERSYREPLAPASRTHVRAYDGSVRSQISERFRFWGILPFAKLVYGGGATICITSPYRWAGLISPTSRSLVGRSAFTLVTVSREASSVTLQRLAAGGEVLYAR